MSCSTLLLLRHRPGPFRLSVMHRCGLAWPMTPAALKDRLLDHAGEGHIVPGELPVGWALIVRQCCGLLIDAPARRVRLYDCDTQTHNEPRLQHAEVQRWAAPLRAAGWDADYAWDRHFALLREAGLPQPPFDPTWDMDYTQQSVWDSACDPEQAWGMGWDPATRTLAFLPGAQHDALCFVTLIEADGTRRERCFALDAVLLLLSEGVGVLDRLRALPPAPPPAWPYEGLVIDLSEKRLLAWTMATLPPTPLAGWPGWRLERLPWCLRDHLAFTGRDPELAHDPAREEHAELVPWLPPPQARVPREGPAVTWVELAWEDQSEVDLAALGVHT